MRVSRYLLVTLIAACSLSLLASFGISPAAAHQNGCHAAHSCPSDTGSYVCGDTGNYNYCPALAGTATISSSKPTVGTALTAYVTWTAAGTATYQWTRNGVAIPGATASAYTIAVEDLGQQVAVVASAVDGRNQTAQAVSTPVVPTAAFKLGLSVSKVRAGRKLKFEGYADSIVDLASRPVIVRIWKKQGHGWSLKRTVSLTTDENGEFSVSQTTPKREATTWKARASFGGDVGLSASKSRVVTVTTRKK